MLKSKQEKVAEREERKRQRMAQSVIHVDDVIAGDDARMAWIDEANDPEPEFPENEDDEDEDDNESQSSNDEADSESDGGIFREGSIFDESDSESDIDEQERDEEEG